MSWVITRYTSSVLNLNIFNIQKKKTIINRRNNVRNPPLTDCLTDILLSNYTKTELTLNRITYSIFCKPIIKTKINLLAELTRGRETMVQSQLVNTLITYSYIKYAKK